MDFLQKEEKSKSTKEDRRLIEREPKWLRVTLVVLLFCITILAILITILFYYGKPREIRFVDSKKTQAVFLRDGQVYYGSINDINDNYLDLQNIYYTKSKPGETFALTKLGCEAHGPTDQMIVNRAEVSYWENLGGDSKVAKAIDQWQSDHPDGIDCTSESANVTNSPKQATSATLMSKEQ